MYKAKRIFAAGLICSAVFAIAAMTGCSSATIPVKVKVPGEFNLSGVSKIALVDFNSVPDDPLAGVFAADKETAGIVQNIVASEFYKSGMYQVANLDIEKEISEKHLAKLANRFDAVIYGRLWWQVSPEYKNTYPQVFSLKTWTNVKYTKNDPVTGKPVELVAKVTDREEDKVATLYYRAWNAHLMLSLTLYRLDKNGKFEKITETYAVASHNFLIDNGAFSENYVQQGKDGSSRASRLQASTEEEKSFFSAFTEKKAKDVSGKVNMVTVSATIPTELQAKVMLANSLASEIGKKLSPTEIPFNITVDFSDDKLFNLLKDGAYKAAKEYIVFKVISLVGHGIADKIDPIVAYDIPAHLIAKPSEDDIDDDDVADAVEDNIDYLYALALCEEATGQYEQALYTYRYIFNLVPEKEYALGISRCLFALGMNDRIQEKTKALKKAARKANLK